MNIPPAIFFLNGDITYPPIQPPPQEVGSDPSLYIGDSDPLNKISEVTNFQKQLDITETMTKQEFDLRVATDPNYPNIVHLQGLRILVILDSFQDEVNRNLADVVMFVKQGIVTVEKNKFGPPRLSFDMQRINVFQMLRAVHSPNVVIVPDFGRREHERDNGAFGEIHIHRNKIYKWIPENQPGKPPHDPEEGE